MKNFDRQREYTERLNNERVVYLAGSQEDAVKIVKDFWLAMPHAKNLTLPQTDEGWMQELTMGDRTKIYPGKLPKERGKWVVVFQGNHQSLTEEALRWLRERDL